MKRDYVKEKGLARKKRGQKGVNFYDSTIWISPSAFLAVVLTNFTEQIVEAIAREVFISPLLIIEGLAGYQSKEP